MARRKYLAVLDALVIRGESITNLDQQILVDIANTFKPGSIYRHHVDIVPSGARETGGAASE